MTIPWLRVIDVDGPLGPVRCHQTCLTDAGHAAGEVLGMTGIRGAAASLMRSRLTMPVAEKAKPRCLEPRRQAQGDQRLIGRRAAGLPGNGGPASVAALLFNVALDDGGSRR